ncbi:AMP-binding protein (plasmid) [Tistrella mobilis]|uniref:AMP-binding protein n=1 Tax=Tistrella mobilis TaxID=171437 RepID=UPI0035592332
MTTSSERMIEGVPGPGQIGRVAIGDVLRRTARRHPDRVAIVEGDRRTTYRRLDDDANRFANYLLAQGLKPGDKVGCICANSTDFIPVIFGIHKAGLVWVPANAMLGVDDIDYIMRHAEVGHVVADDVLAAQPAMAEMLAKLGRPVTVIEVPGSPVPKGSLPYISFGAAIEGRSTVEPEVAIDERDLALIMYTSGTTSRPKGVMHCHLAVVMAAMSNSIEWQIGREDGVTGVLPLFHCAQHTVLLTTMMGGAKMHLMRGFDPAVMLEGLAAEGLTIMVGLPLMYRALLEHPLRKERSLHLRMCVYAMAPMPEPLMRRLLDEFCPDFRLSSGQTEMYPGTVMSRPERARLRFGNYWGESCIVNDTAIMDDDGNLLPPGKPGEIVHRGPNAMLGYYKQPEATAAARLHGWHHTGDIGVIDEHGELLFLDRKKDMIKSGGENVPSIKIEEVLLGHPDVQNAVVVGIPHARWGEAVTAFLVAKPGTEPTEDSIVEHCRRQLGGFEVPKLVVFLEEMPMTATGKVRKTELRSRYAGHFEPA